MSGRVTEVLDELRRGEAGAQQRLLHLVHGELKQLAASHMRKQPPGHTLQPTALVNEAYLKLMGGSASFADRGHFYRTAAGAMRSILVDFARRKGALRRGGDRHRVTFDESVHGWKDAEYDVLAIHEALDRLEAVDAQMARVVELRFFAGLTVTETTAVMGIAERTVYWIWEHARRWLYRELNPGA